MYPLRLVARLDGPDQLAPALQVGARASRPGVEIFLEARFRPAVPREDLHVLRRQDHEGLPRAEAAQARHGVAERHEDRFRRLSVMAEDIVRPLGGNDGDGARPARESPLHVQPLPGILFLALRAALAVLAGMALCRLVEDPGLRAQAVERDE